jgi:hypothetical protein
MNRVVKLTVIGAAIAGAVVGTVAFLRSRGSHNPELVDYDELADAAGDAIDSGKDAASSTFDAAKEAVADAADA